MNEIFLICLAIILAGVFRWAFRTLPHENWQILAALPKKKFVTGEWQGENLTYYGVFNACAYLFAVSVVMVLLGSIFVPIPAIAAVVAVTLAICVPSSSLIARFVEKKNHTFTVGGASFAGILLIPWAALLTDAAMKRWMNMSIPVLPALAAVAIAYAFGEGLGRLACISFGCCYGKPLGLCPGWVNRLFENQYMVFHGKTKKISYAHGLDGQKMFPVQAVTVTLYSLFGLAGIYLFLLGHYRSAYILTLMMTQVWRFFSEFLRADYRGEGRISVYQKMSVFAAIYGGIVLLFLPDAPLRQADVLTGLGYLWNPLIILILQGLWFAIFLRTGRSRVTGSNISFHVIKERI